MNIKELISERALDDLLQESYQFVNTLKCLYEEEFVPWKEFFVFKMPQLNLRFNQRDY